MLDKFRETAITWDKANRKVYEPLRVSAGDNKGRKLSVQVVNGGVIENITGSSLSLFWETRDKAHRGLDVFTTVDATKGEFEIYYTTGMLSNEGVLNANLVLVDTSGRVVSEPFTITVFKGIDDDAIQSSDSFTALTEALIDISDLEQNYAPRLNDLTAQLQQKAGKVEVQQLIGEISDGTPLFADSTANMTDASRLYVNTSDGVLYVHDGAMWVSTGVLYQSTGLDNDSVLPRHLTANSTPIVKDQSLYTSSALESTLYIPNETVDAGLINATFSTSAVNNGEIYLLEKIGETNDFIVKGKKQHTSVTGENNVSTGLIAEGNGFEYVGLRGFKINFKSDGNPDGFFEKGDYDGKTTPFTATKKTNTFDFSLYITYSDVTLSEQVNKIKADIGDLSTSISTPDALKSFNTLKFRETVGNYSTYPDAYFQGRWFVKQVNGIDCVTTINAGSEIYAKFTGTSIKADFPDNNTGSAPYIAVSVDGGEFVRMLAGYGVITLASGLEDKEHYIRVVADGLNQNDDVWLGGEGLAFKAFILEAGKEIKPIKPFNKLALFIGDSITAGIRNISSSSAPSSSSAYQSFAGIASNELNISGVRVGFGATGVEVSGAGGVPNANVYVDYTKNGIIAKEQAPDFIVINHGTNDNTIDSLTFKNAYESLLTRFNIIYPGSPIICMRPFNGAHGADIEEVAQRFSNCFYVDTSSWVITTTDGLHPDLAGSKVAGLALAEEMKKIFGLSYFVA